MKHYDVIEWKLYKGNLLDKDIYEEMGRHLFQCEDCMDIYLSLIDDKEIGKAGEIISDQFTNDLMKRIGNVRYISKTLDKDKYKKKRRFYNEILLYYAAVASVAIFLTGTGFFQRIIEKTPEIAKNIEEQQLVINTNKINEFSSSILRLTGSFAEGFTFKNREEK